MLYNKLGQNVRDVPCFLITLLREKSRGVEQIVFCTFRLLDALRNCTVCNDFVHWQAPNKSGVLPPILIRGPLVYAS